MPRVEALDQRTFDRVRGLIYDRAGISLGESKKAMVVGRLAKRLRALGEDSLDTYLSILDDPNSDEWQNFTNALTTNLTSFFRESHHFDHLAQVLRQARGQDLFRIWCCASSTGEEPYSIAMTVAEVGTQGPRKVEIMSSDIDTNVLERAAIGIYTLDRIDGLSKKRIKQFLLKGKGPRQGYCKVRPSLQKNMSFHQVNLLSDRWHISGPLDVIFCRNVMIYFDKPTQQKLVRRFSNLLVPGAYLYVGHSESQFGCEDLLKPVGRTTYQRMGG